MVTVMERLKEVGDSMGGAKDKGGPGTTLSASPSLSPVPADLLFADSTASFVIPFTELPEIIVVHVTEFL